MSESIGMVPQDDYVLSVNGWRKAIQLPRADSNGNVLAWGAFHVTTTGTAPAVTLATDTTGSAPVVTLSVARGNLVVGDFRWWLAEDGVYTGDVFLTGTVHVEGEA
jgi:hypothetical protein